MLNPMGENRFYSDLGGNFSHVNYSNLGLNNIYLTWFRFTVVKRNIVPKGFTLFLSVFFSVLMVW